MAQNQHIIIKSCLQMMSMQEIYVKDLREDDIPTLEHHPVMTEQFKEVFREMLSLTGIPSELAFRNVLIEQGQYIHQLYTVGNHFKPHLVCLHGFGATSFAYLKMFKHLKDHFQIHALDTFGMGLSSRGRWNDEMTSEEALAYYVDAVEAWRKRVKLQRFILVAHSFGGLIASHYVQKYAFEQVQHLFLLSPAGTSVWTQQEIQQKADEGRSYFGCFGRLGFNMNIRPTKVVNVCCLGNMALNYLLNSKLKLPEEEQAAWKNYIKLVSEQEKVSEQGFYLLIKWPASPTVKSIESIIAQLHEKIPVTFVYGDQDWMQTKAIGRLAQQRKNVTINIIQKAGHQLIFDHPTNVAAAIIQACSHH